MKLDMLILSQSHRLGSLFLNYDQTKLQVDNPIFLNLCLFLVFVFAILVTLRKTDDDQPFSFLQTEQMKGLAIIMVIVSHLYNHVLERYSDLATIAGELGCAGVAIFLTLSGFGLCISIQRKGLKKFFSKRVIKLYIPVVFAMGMEILLSHSLNLQKGNIFSDFVRIFVNLPSVDRNMWFIVFILFWYCMTYLVFKLNITNKERLFLLCCICVVFLPIPRISSSWKINAFSFPVGCFLGLNSDFIIKKVKSLLERNIVLLVGVLLSIFLLSQIVHEFVEYKLSKPGSLGTVLIAGIAAVTFLVCLLKQKVKIDISMETLSTSLAIIAICFYLKWVLNGSIFGNDNIASWIIGNFAYITLTASIMLLISLMIKLHVYSLFLNFIGKISFELYLLHGMFMYSFDFILFRGNIIATFFVYFAAICLVGVVLKRLSSLTLKLLPS